MSSPITLGLVDKPSEVTDVKSADGLANTGSAESEAQSPVLHLVRIPTGGYSDGAEPMPP
jgi:hypothetical protein